ncbi:MAG TPA: NADP-dependent malic enzyme [Candidatus Paceibacterota bacterium]|nr:NADP-dependent malic enzyme [Candidatus Paceibacterota bacterium]
MASKKQAGKNGKKGIAKKPGVAVARTPKEILAVYKNVGARIETSARVRLRTKQDLSLFYTPGVGVASSHLATHPEDARKLSVKRNSVAVISDGSAVLGLGNIGPYGALPVMEGKALIFKEMANVDAWPIVLDTQDPEEIIRTVRAIAPSFGGINLEDIKAPQCFEIEQALIDSLDIPVMHDDQHGTAIVALAGLMNASKVVTKNLKKLRIVISGAGAAGTAVAKLLVAAGISDVIVLDRGGAIYNGRPDLNAPKQELSALTNPRLFVGDLSEALADADVFIGVSGPNLLTRDHISTMADKAIVFALSNPAPEILPDEAYAGGAAVVATGRSDFPNQINNALVFPGVFRGALDKGIRRITDDTKLRAAKALAGLVPAPTAQKLLPDMFDARVVPTIAKAVR